MGSDRRQTFDGSPAFKTTHWSLVVAAGQRSSPEGKAALEQLCQTYGYPLYAFIRCHGHGPDAAQDLTQAFFARLLERDMLTAADRNRGKFRTFLLSALKNFLTDQTRWDKSQKRGGDRIRLSLHMENGERRYLAEPVEDMTPEKYFEKQWASAVIDQAMQTLRAEYEQTGRDELFEHLKDHLWGNKAISYAEIAQAFEMSEGSVKAAAFRLRKRFGALLRTEIAQTVQSPDEVDEELEALIQLFG